MIEGNWNRSFPRYQCAMRPHCSRPACAFFRFVRGCRGGGRWGGGSGGRGTVDINLALKFICPGGLDHRNVTKREARNFEEFPG